VATNQQGEEPRNLNIP